MGQTKDRVVEAPNDAAQPGALGAFIRKARQDVSMSLRDVEDATNKEVSNGYLSQLESGKITKPSPHVLHALSLALSVDYETLMQRAGYILPTAQRAKRMKHGRPGTFAIDNLTADEESQLLEYLTFLNRRRRSDRMRRSDDSSLTSRQPARSQKDPQRALQQVSVCRSLYPATVAQVMPARFNWQGRAGRRGDHS